MFTDYCAACGLSFEVCSCEPEEVTAVDEDGAEARLVRSHGGFADLLAALAVSLKKPVAR